MYFSKKQFDVITVYIILTLSQMKLNVYHIYDKHDKPIKYVLIHYNYI